MNEVIQTILDRRSTKAYSDRPLEQEKLEQILLAGTYAANGMGHQAAKIVVLTKPEDISVLEKMNAAVMGKPELHPFYGAPVVCVVLAETGFFTGVEDGALVIGNMLLAAQSLGVGGCWIHRAREVFDTEEGKALLKKWGVSGNYTGVGHCILGYPAAAPKPAAPRKPDYVVMV